MRDIYTLPMNLLCCGASRVYQQRELMHFRVINQQSNFTFCQTRLYRSLLFKIKSRINVVVVVLLHFTCALSSFQYHERECVIKSSGRFKYAMSAVMHVIIKVKIPFVTKCGFLRCIIIEKKSMRIIKYAARIFCLFICNNKIK